MRTYGSSCDRVLTSAPTEGAGPRAQRTQGPCGIASDHGVLVVQCPSQRRLDRLCIGRQVDEGISSAAADGGSPIAKQFRQHWNGRRTDPADDLERHLVQVFIQIVEEMLQQWQRTPGSFDQGGFGNRPDLRIAGRQTTCPVTHRGGARGKNRSRGLGRLRPGRRGLSRWYRQTPEQRADEHVSHARDPIDAKRSTQARVAIVPDRS